MYAARSTLSGEPVTLAEVIETAIPPPGRSRRRMAFTLGVQETSVVSSSADTATIHVTVTRIGGTVHQDALNIPDTLLARRRIRRRTTTAILGVCRPVPRDIRHINGGETVRTARFRSGFSGRAISRCVFAAIVLGTGLGQPIRFCIGFRVDVAGAGSGRPTSQGETEVWKGKQTVESHAVPPSTSHIAAS